VTVASGPDLLERRFWERLRVDHPELIGSVNTRRLDENTFGSYRAGIALTDLLRATPSW